MKIFLNQKFGLGNQLFQYAAGVYFANRYSAILEVIKEHEELAVSFGRPRPFLLERFNISAPVRSRTLLDRLMRSDVNLIAKGTAPLRKILGVYSHDPHFEIVSSFWPDLPLPKGARRVYLNGHFQVYGYAKLVEQRLRKEFTFKDEPIGKNLEVAKRIRDCDCPVSLHVRRGDYTIGWQGQNLLPDHYYEKAIRTICEQHPNVTFFVFSDDIPGARQSLQHLSRAIFVDHNDEASAHEDLRLMSLCRHHILANSTFSWWGAWLNQNPEKTVLVPRPWHLTDDHSELILPEWTNVLWLTSTKGRGQPSEVAQE